LKSNTRIEAFLKDSAKLLSKAEPILATWISSGHATLTWSAH